MSEMKFTPGPWECFGSGAVMATGACVAQAHWISGVITADAMDANARLIAAAPELFDLALNVGGLNDRTLDHAGAFELRAIIREYREQARAALAKARGGTP